MSTLPVLIVEDSSVLREIVDRSPRKMGFVLTMDQPKSATQEDPA